MKNKISLGQSILISPQIKLLMTFFGLADLSLGLNIEVLMGPEFFLLCFVAPVNGDFSGFTRSRVLGFSLN